MTYTALSWMRCHPAGHFPFSLLFYGFAFSSQGSAGHSHSLEVAGATPFGTAAVLSLHCAPPAATEISPANLELSMSLLVALLNTSGS